MVVISRSGAGSVQITVIDMIFMLDISREAVPRHHDGQKWEPSRYNAPNNFGYFSTVAICKRLMTFYSGLGGVVGLVECHIRYFDGIFALMGRSLQSIQVKQFMLCEGKVLKFIRFHYCVL